MYCGHVGHTECITTLGPGATCPTCYAPSTSSQRIFLGQDCAICLERIESVSFSAVIPCGHVYHGVCLGRLIAVSARNSSIPRLKCPMCKCGVTASKPILVDYESRLLRSEADDLVRKLNDSASPAEILSSTSHIQQFLEECRQLTPIRRSAIGTAGGIASLVDAMSRFPDNVRIQRRVTNTLSTLFHRPFLNKKRMVDVGGVRLLLHNMMHHDGEVAHGSLMALGSLLCSYAAEVPKMSPDNIERLIFIMRSNAHHRAIQSGGNQIIRRMWTSDSTVRSQLPETACPALVVKASEIFPDDKQIEKGMCVLFPYACHCFVRQRQ